MPHSKELPRLIRNTTSLTVADTIARLCSAAFVVVAARRLGVDGYGLYATVMTFVLFARTAGIFGLQQVLIRDIAPRKESASQYVSSAILLLFPLGLLLWAVMPHLVGMLGYGHELRVLLTLVGAVLVGNAVARPVEGMLRAFERMTLLSAVKAALSMATALAGMLLVLAGHGLRALMVLQVVSAWSEAGLLLVLTHYRVSPLGWKPSLATIRWLAREGSILFSLTMLNLAKRRIDVLFLARFSGPEAVGWYIIGVRILEYLSIPRLGAIGALFPVMSVRWQESPDALSRVCTRALRFFALYAVGIAVVLSVGAEPLLGLIFGVSYLPGANALRFLAWAMVAHSLSGPIWAVIVISRRRLARLIPVIGVLALCNMGLLLWLIPRWAHIGAAMAALISASIGLVVHIWWIRGIVGVGELSFRAVIWRPILAGMAMAMVFLLLRSVGFWWSLFPAGLVYLSMLFAVGAFRPKELGWAKDLAHRVWPA